MLVTLRLHRYGVLKRAGPLYILIISAVASRMVTNFTSNLPSVSAADNSRCPSSQRCVVLQNGPERKAKEERDEAAAASDVEMGSREEHQGSTAVENHAEKSNGSAQNHPTAAADYPEAKKPGEGGPGVVAGVVIIVGGFQLCDPLGSVCLFSSSYRFGFFVVFPGGLQYSRGGVRAWGSSFRTLGARVQGAGGERLGFSVQDDRLSYKDNPSKPWHYVRAAVWGESEVLTWAPVLSRRNVVDGLERRASHCSRPVPGHVLERRAVRLRAAGRGEA